MNSHYLYLIIDLAAFTVPFLFSFHPKLGFARKWRYVIPGILLSALVFIVWDILFTEAGIWGFNERYLTGYYVYNLPIEEVLFFFCIPYACLFTHHALTTLIEKDHLFPHHEIITSILIIVSLIAGIYFMERAYTAATFLATGFFLAYHMLKIRPNYMGRFYFSFLVILIPFFIVNGILTGSFIDEEVVWYNDDENTTFRIGTIPIEDFFYGMIMVLIPLTIAEVMELGWPQKRKTPKAQGSAIQFR